MFLSGIYQGVSHDCFFGWITEEKEREREEEVLAYGACMIAGVAVTLARILR